MENRDNSKLTRMTLGGLENLPSYSGDNEDYFRMGEITLEGVYTKGRIKGKRPAMKSSALYCSPDYDPRDVDSFLEAIQGYLEFQDFALTHVMRDATWPKGRQRVKATIYKQYTHK